MPDTTTTTNAPVIIAALRDDVSNRAQGGDTSTVQEYTGNYVDSTTKQRKRPLRIRLMNGGESAYYGTIPSLRRIHPGATVLRYEDGGAYEGHGRDEEDSEGD